MRYTITQAKEECAEFNDDLLSIVPWYFNRCNDGRGPVTLSGAYGGYQVQAVMYGSTGAHGWGGFDSARMAAETLRRRGLDVKRAVLRDSVKGIGGGARESFVCDSWDGCAEVKNTPAGRVFTYYGAEEHDGHRPGFAVCVDDAGRAFICG